MHVLSTGFARRAVLRASIGVLVAVFALGAIPARSRAATMVPGPAFFWTGLVDDPLFVYSSSSVSSLWLARARELDSSSVRISAEWDFVAPSQLSPNFRPADPGDPHYQWATLDTAVRNATAAGERVVLIVTHAPTWAEGQNPPSDGFAGAWRPNPGDLRAFAHALASRSRNG